MQIHRNERRSAVRLKHKDDEINVGSQLLMRKTTQQSVSHAAGVLLGNNHNHMASNTAERLATATMRNNHNDTAQLIREFANESKNSAGCTGVSNLKSVYDMRVSHSNLAAKNAKM